VTDWLTDDRYISGSIEWEWLILYQSWTVTLLIYYIFVVILYDRHGQRNNYFDLHRRYCDGDLFSFFNLFAWPPQCPRLIFMTIYLQHCWANVIYYCRLRTRWWNLIFLINLFILLFIYSFIYSNKCYDMALNHINISMAYALDQILYLTSSLSSIFHNQYCILKRLVCIMQFSDWMYVNSQLSYIYSNTLRKICFNIGII